jgi:flagellum-specific peptidoglycan hydrolase FlgJ
MNNAPLETRHHATTTTKKTPKVKPLVKPRKVATKKTSKKSTTNKYKVFGEKIKPKVEKAIQKAKANNLKVIPSVKMLTAQIAYETGGGTSYIYREGNNIAGTHATKEAIKKKLYVKAYDDGAIQKFRKYSSVDEAIYLTIKDHYNNGRYNKLKDTQSVWQQAYALSMGGWATNPKYPGDIARVAAMIFS